LSKTPVGAPLLNIEASFCTVKVPVAALRRIPPLAMLIAPLLVQVAAPFDTSVRPLTVLVLNPPRVMGPLTVKEPPPETVPLFQLNAPLTVTFPAPVTVPESKVRTPLAPTVLSLPPVRVSVFPLLSSVCVPLAPPSTRLFTVLLTLSVTVYVPGTVITTSSPGWGGKGFVLHFAASPQLPLTALNHVAVAARASSGERLAAAVRNSARSVLQVRIRPPLCRAARTRADARRGCAVVYLNSPSVDQGRETRTPSQLSLPLDVRGAAG
jgi:hypothetical protein